MAAYKLFFSLHVNKPSLPRRHVLENKTTLKWKWGEGANYEKCKQKNNLLAAILE